MSTFRIAVIEGDGIGKEVVPAGRRVLDAASCKFGFKMQWCEFDWSCDYFQKFGRMMPEDGLVQLSVHDAIFLGAVGWPNVPDHISLWGLLIPIRMHFQQYANVRPVKLFKGVASPLVGKQQIDFVVVRENSEGEYSSIGGRFHAGSEEEVVVQQSIFTRRGVDRILRFAFELARQRPRRHLTSATKSNGIIHTMPYWDERFKETSKLYPDVTVEQYHVDVLAAHFVRKPESFDVVVGSNLFGDILSDLGPALTGSIGMSPSANLDPTRKFPSMFEPVHGSAPDIAGRNISNPIGQIWSGAMMLQHFGELTAADAIINAVERVLAENGPRTPDLGGTASTQSVTDAIIDSL